MAKKKKSNLSAMDAPVMDEKYQAECDMRTMMEMAKLLKDPGRLKKAGEASKEQHKAIRSIAQLKALRNGDDDYE